MGVSNDDLGSRVHQANDASGAYQIEAPGTMTKRYTAYIKYIVGPDDGEDHFYEEIDVNARSEPQARAIAQFVMERDYEPGGNIHDVREQVGWYM